MSEIETIDWTRYDRLVGRLAAAIMGEQKNEITLMAVVALAATVAKLSGITEEQTVELLRAAMSPDPTLRGAA